MVAKIDIDVPKIQEKIKNKMRLNIGKLLKQPVSTQDLLVLKKKSVRRLAHFWKCWKLIVTVNEKVYPPTTLRRFTPLKNCSIEKVVFLTLIQKCNYVLSFIILIIIINRGFGGLEY